MAKTKIYQWILFDTEYYVFEVITAHTELEANLKAWKFIVELELSAGEDLYDKEYCDVTTFEDFCKSDRCYFPFLNGCSLQCKLVVTEI